MNRTQRAKRLVVWVLLGGSLVGGSGCDQDIASQLAMLCSNYVGDAASIVVSHYLQDALGVEGATDGHAEEHDHDSGALHDHEH
jgi:hypothetical protein